MISSNFARYCPTCKNDTSEVVKAGEKLKASKKKAKMPSATTESQRDWGKVRRKERKIETACCAVNLNSNPDRRPNFHRRSNECVNMNKHKKGGLNIFSI